MDSGDRIEILWAGGVTRGVYADHRDGGRVIIDHPDEGPVLMHRSEFGRCKLRGGMGEPWGTDLDLLWDSLYGQGAVDDTTAMNDPTHAPGAIDTSNAKVPLALLHKTQGELERWRDEVKQLRARHDRYREALESIRRHLDCVTTVGTSTVLSIDSVVRHALTDPTSRNDRPEDS